MTKATEATGPQAETLEPAKGLDAILSTAIEDSGYGDEPTTETAEQEPAKTDGDVKIDATGRAHAADGKFAPKKTAEAEPSVTEPAKAEATPAEATPVEPLKAEPIQPPARWSEADKAEFAKLTPEAQKLLVARYNAIEGDYTRKTQELAENRKAVEPLVQEVGKWSPYLQSIGLSPQQAFTQLLSTEHTLRTGTPEQKINAFAYLAELYGIPLPTPDGQAQAPNPAFTQLHQQVSSLQQQLQQIAEQRQLEERQRAQAEFDALGQTKDQNGQAKFPHFQRVSQAMIQLVASGQADTWDAAYDKAVWGDPELRQQQVEAERQRVLAEAEKQRLEAVEKAKKAGPVKSSDGAPKGGQQLKGLDAHLNAAIDRMGVGG